MLPLHLPGSGLEETPANPDEWLQRGSAGSEGRSTQSAHPALEAAHVAPACPSSVLLLHKKHLTVLLPVSPVLAVWGLRLCSQLKESRDHWQENVPACFPHWHVERPRPAMAVVTCIIPAQQCSRGLSVARVGN